MDHSPDCPLHGRDRGDLFDRAVHAAALAFLEMIEAQPGAIITIRGNFELPSDEPDADDVIARITIGIGRVAQDKIAAEHASDVLNTEGAPWMN